MAYFVFYWGGRAASKMVMTAFNSAKNQKLEILSELLRLQK